MSSDQAQPDAADAGPPAVTEKLYADLRNIAARMFRSERAGHTLQPTAVVNEACMRIMSVGLPDVSHEQRLALAGRVLKQVLIDHARARNADKRGGGSPRVGLDRDVLADNPTHVDLDSINLALERLRQLNERQAEVTTLRMFSGLTMDQVATVLGVSKCAAEADWTVARAWLRRELATAIGESRP